VFSFVSYCNYLQLLNVSQSNKLTIFIKYFSRFFWIDARRGYASAAIDLLPICKRESIKNY